MKQYVVDEIRPSDFEAVRKYLDEHCQRQSIDDLYRIPLSEALYSEIQKDHEDCQPFYFAVELKTDALYTELLVRSEKIIRCDCIAYATDTQRQWLMETIDAVFEKLNVIT